MIDINPDTSFFVLDFDRTLGNTDKFHEVLEDTIAKETNLTVDFLRHARFKAEDIGQSFDTISYLREHLRDTGSLSVWPDIQRKFINAAQRQDMLEPGANELLRLLKAKGFRFGILTYGNEAWQLAKLEAAWLLSVPHLVTHIQEKGQILKEWKHAAGDFVIPPSMTEEFVPFHARTIVFLDDKSKSFASIPTNVVGVRIRPPEGIKLEEQKGPLPLNVIEVDGIHGAITFLFKYS